jgi:1-deoxy-D-xylulose-5-phosphate synthase
MDVVAAEPARLSPGLPGVDVVRHGPCEILIVTAGPVTVAGTRVADMLHERGFGVTVARSRWIVPVRPELLRLIAQHRLAVTIEDVLADASGGSGAGSGAGAGAGAGAGSGAGGALAQACAAAGVTTPLRAIRLPRGFFEHREVLMTIAGLIGVDAALAGHRPTGYPPIGLRRAQP